MECHASMNVKTSNTTGDEGDPNHTFLNIYVIRWMRNHKGPNCKMAYECVWKSQNIGICSPLGLFFFIKKIKQICSCN